jgi:methylated-DNA-protein-cysteine methyltransferase-like protein
MPNHLHGVVVMNEPILVETRSGASLPPHKQGRLETNRLVWRTIRQIPKGKVATYGEIAKLCGLIGQARLVGRALHQLPANSNAPWHRVVNSSGKISLPRMNGAFDRQKQLLEEEGVSFLRNKIDLRKFGWLRSLEVKEPTRIHSKSSR